MPERSASSSPAIPLEIIEQRIYLIRGRKVILDSDLAELYGVETKNFNKAVKRNLGRFPQDFMFKLTQGEADNLRFQIGTSSWGGRRYLPYVFTEQGVAMLSSVLKSEQAIRVNIAIMRVFARLRELLASHAELLRRLDDLEREQKEQGGQIELIFGAIRKLIEQPMEELPDREEKKFGF
ncbi:MAG TPA: ORF6N domain-containing protein [Candidatus Paceibacterota bacterium]|jgi:hypothetical protein|nr:ORF6N domain-containing protein [Candidatus Paceibacterota bacterium]